MSYYFTILSPTDAPLFSQSFGTSKAGGDGLARFRFPDTARYMNQFLVHASLDVVEEVQWTNGAMYLKVIDTYPPASAYISAFVTGTGARFLLLHQPPGAPTSAANPSTIPPGSASSLTASSSFFSSTTAASSMMLPGAGGGGSGSGTSSPFSAATSRASSSSIANNPTSPQTEEAVRQFMNEVYENWVKTVMSPFYQRGVEITSPVFRARVLAAGRKWL